MFTSMPTCRLVQSVLSKIWGKARKSTQAFGGERQKRKLHYKRYTGQDWGVSQNYHLCLDSSALGIGRCVDMIIEAHEDHPDEIDWEA